MDGFFETLNRFLGPWAPAWLLTPSAFILAAGVVLIVFLIGLLGYRHVSRSQVISPKSPLMKGRSNYTIRTLRQQQISKQLVQNIYAFLEARNLPPEDHDLNFRKFTERYTALRAALTTMNSEDSVINKCNQLAWEEIEKGEFDKAKYYLRRAYKRDIDAMEDPSELRHSRQMSAAMNQYHIAGLYMLKFDYRRAAQEYRKAADLVPESPFYQKSKAEYLNKCGTAYMHAGQFDQAEQLFLESKNYQDAPPAAEPQAGRISQDFAQYFADEGHFESAELLYKRSLQIYETMRETHPGHETELANLLSRLAYLYIENHCHSEAEPLLKRALEIRKEVLGSEDPSVSASICDLAELYRELGDHEKAEELYLRAISLREAVNGENHPEVAPLLVRLGALYCQMKRYQEAGPLYTRAIKIQESQLANDHPDLIDSFQGLGAVLEALGKGDKAERVYQKALHIARKHFDDEHAVLGRVLFNLAVLHTNREEFNKAHACFDKAMPLFEKHYGSKHPETAQVYQAYADLLYSMEKLDVAETYIDKAKAILGKAETFMNPS